MDENRRPYHHGGLREVLLAEGRRLLCEVGAEAVSLREIARRASVSPRAPYRHFESRESLLAALASEGFRELMAGFPPEGGDPAERLRQMGRAYVQYARAEPAVFRLMFSGLISHPSVHEQSMLAFQCLVSASRFVSPAGSGLKEWVRFATAIWSGLHGIALIGNDAVGDLYSSEAFVSPEELIDALCRGWLDS